MRLRVAPTKKQSRQDVMLKLIKEDQIKTQEGLKKALTAHGFNVTQSSLSRDIKELGLVKQHGAYVIPPRHMHSTTPPITTIDASGTNLLVIKTVVGMAAPVGITIDSHKLPGVIGSVAGDDTVFVALAQGSSIESVKKAIKRLFREG